MKKQFGYPNTIAVPRIVRVALNTVIGKLITSNPTIKEKLLEEISKDLAAITGQKPKVLYSTRSISSFKLREGMPIGLMVTLRGKRMFDFISRFINIALPRTRDFRGIDPKSFDQGGNLTVGVKEHIVFSEMIGEDYHFLFGFEVTVATTAKKKEEGIELLRLMGFPIK